MKRNVMLGTAIDGQGGIAAVLATYKEAGFFDKWNIRFIATHCAGSALRKLSTLVSGYLVFLALLLTGQVGVVHIHTASNASFWRKSLFILLASIFGRSVILHVHGGGFADFFNVQCGSLQQRYVRYIMRRCSCIVALSEKWAVRLHDISAHSHIVTVYNPVALPDLTKQIFVRDQSSILFLGRIGPAKGVYDLLQALLVLREEFPSLRLLCGGDGEQEKFLAAATELKLREHVELLGWVVGAAKTRYLAQCTVFALPSYAEGMPVGVLEAMATGAPVVASKVGGIPDTIRDGIDGLLIDAGDVAALVAALAQVLRDPVLQRQLGNAGKQRVETIFAASKVMEQMGVIYSELGAVPVKGNCLA
jgi:glycosyltransferase involved in cell wall biosynthesis